MRPLISWADLAGRRVGVWGPAGVEGQANLRTLAALGVAPAVLVDDSPAGAGHGPAVLATADGGLEALASCDVVIKAPGISRYLDDARFGDVRIDKVKIEAKAPSARTFATRSLFANPRSLATS